MKAQLRIATAGSVDDGKSTLIGRLLHDTKTVFEDQLTAVKRASLRYGDGEMNLALLTDGLKAERQQGITIDVAYRYFATPSRSFVVADTPGHAEYTRNMVTGASVSDVAIVLVDARKGLSEQTRRHLYISVLLGVHEIVLAVNKMDLVEWDEVVFNNVAKAATEFVEAMPAPIPLVAVPISALEGDNVVSSSSRSTWYLGPSLLEILEHIDIDVDGHSEVGSRLAVQWVIRVPNGGRLFAGQLGGGGLSVGDAVVVLPSGRRSKIAVLDRFGESVPHVDPGRAVAVGLEDEIDIGRGDVIVPAEAAEPAVTNEITADVCWMTDRPLDVGARVKVKHLTSIVDAQVIAIDSRTNVDTLENEPVDQLQLNDLGSVRLRLATPIVADTYHQHREGGRFVAIDPATNETVAAGMVR
jgi:sulfate adenylyltransferase large subunit